MSAKILDELLRVLFAHESDSAGHLAPAGRRRTVLSREREESRWRRPWPEATGVDACVEVAPSCRASATLDAHQQDATAAWPEDAHQGLHATDSSVVSDVDLHHAGSAMDRVRRRVGIASLHTKSLGLAQPSSSIALSRWMPPETDRAAEGFAVRELQALHDAHARAMVQVSQLRYSLATQAERAVHENLLRQDQAQQQAAALTSELRRVQQQVVEQALALEQAAHKLALEQARIGELRRRVEYLEERKRGVHGAPISVHAALLLARDLYDDHLSLHRQAILSARTCNYATPSEVVSAIGHLVAHKLMGGDPEEFFRRRYAGRLRYRAKDREATRNEHRTEERFRCPIMGQGGRTAHLTLGHGFRGTLQIYFTTHDDGRIEITHCGEHLPTFRRCR